MSALHFYITEASHSADGNLSTLTHCILCRSETLVSCCRGNAAWMHMITFLIHFPIPIATICPLLHTTILKEKIFTSMSRKLFKILGLFYDPQMTFVFSQEIVKVTFIKQHYFFKKIAQASWWHFFIFIIKKHIDWMKTLHKQMATACLRGNCPALMKM